MTTYITADSIATAPVNVLGAGAPVYDTVLDFLFSGVTTDLETYANAYLALLNPTTNLTLMGSAFAAVGMGDLATVAMLAGDNDGGFVPFADPLDGAGGLTGGHFFFYRADTEAELAVQCAACKARMVAWAEGLTGDEHCYYIDHFLAGGKHGGFFGGFFLWRGTAQPS